MFVNGTPSTSALFEISAAVPTRPLLIDPRMLVSGPHASGFQFRFTNSVGALFGALASTNVALPLSNWTPLGLVSETSPGQFQFRDPQAVDNQQLFYAVRSP